MKSGRDDLGGLVGRCRPSQRGAQPGEELVHAERLRHVVVGARVERRDLVPLALPHREHDDRNLRPAAQTLDHLDAVDPGQAEVEDDEVGMIARCERQRELAGRCEVDLVVARLRFVPSARRSWGSSSTTRIRVTSPP